VSNAVLAGCTVWLTRPAHQAASWAAAIEAAGGTALCEPLLDIQPPADERTARAELARAADADIVIATSANAVAGAWALQPDFAPSGLLFGVGSATARALAAASGRSVAQPADCYSSEDLLALDSLTQTVGRRIALLSGEGGRTALAETLTERGAQVDKVALYRRMPAAVSRSALAALASRCHAIVVTSGEALACLDTLLADVADADTRDRLLGCRLVAPSMRVVKQQGICLRWSDPPVIVDRVSADAVVLALARIWRGNRQ